MQGKTTNDPFKRPAVFVRQLQHVKVKSEKSRGPKVCLVGCPMLSLAPLRDPAVSVELLHEPRCRNKGRRCVLSSEASSSSSSPPARASLCRQDVERADPW